MPAEEVGTESGRSCPSCGAEVPVWGFQLLELLASPAGWVRSQLSGGDSIGTTGYQSSGPAPPVDLSEPTRARSPNVNRPTADQSTPTTKTTSPLARARKALLVVLGLLAVLWIIQIINNGLNYRLSNDLGVQPRVLSTLPYIFTSPFLHWSWAHIEGNSIPFLILGFLAAYRNIRNFLIVTGVVIVTSGLFYWMYRANQRDRSWG